MSLHSPPRVALASPADTPPLVAMVRELAEYERLVDHVRFTPGDLFVRPAFRGRGQGEVLLRALAGSNSPQGMNA